MKNKTRIKIVGRHTLGNMPLSKVLEKLCLLRTARKIGDEEVVNNTQLGRLRDNNITFEIVQTKIYSREDVIQLCEDAMRVGEGNGVADSHGDAKPFDEIFKGWVKEKLPETK